MGDTVGRVGRVGREELRRRGRNPTVRRPESFLAVEQGYERKRREGPRGSRGRTSSTSRRSTGSSTSEDTYLYSGERSFVSRLSCELLLEICPASDNLLVNSKTTS